MGGRHVLVGLDPMSKYAQVEKALQLEEWRRRRNEAEELVRRRKGDLIGAGSNTYRRAEKALQEAQKQLAEADRHIRDLSDA